MRYGDTKVGGESESLRGPTVLKTVAPVRWGSLVSDNAGEFVSSVRLCPRSSVEIYPWMSYECCMVDSVASGA